MNVVYVLFSNRDGRRYIGSTNNLERRLREHLSGKCLSTRDRRPLVLIYQESFDTLRQARLREKYFKTHKGFNELNKLIPGGPTPAARASGA